MGDRGGDCRFEKNPTKIIFYCYGKHYWEDKRVFLEWTNTHMCNISADNHTKVDGFKEEIPILKYNLDGKVQKQYQDMCGFRTNTLLGYLSTEYTDDLAPPDVRINVVE